MNARARKEKGNQRKCFYLEGKMWQNEAYIRRYMHLLNVISPEKYQINTTACFHPFIEDKSTQMCVAVFHGKNPFRYEPF